MLETCVTYKVMVGDFAKLDLLYNNEEVRTKINVCIQSVESCWLLISSLPPVKVLCFFRHSVLAVTTEFVQNVEELRLL